MKILRGVLMGALISAASPSLAAPNSCAASKSAIEAYIAPYVQTNNFFGVVLAACAGTPVFAKAYGFADRERHVPNSLRTRFHIASMSMQFTAAAALRLIDERRLSLDTPVSDIVAGFPNGEQITVKHLLTETSGIADINSQADYGEVLRHHQTPLSLVERVRNLPPLRNPGTFEREEHSAYNLLALIVEERTGLPFAEAVRKLVFQPLGMKDSGIDDDAFATGRDAAKGYQPVRLYDIELVGPIHWSAKAGNASAYTTAADELRFLKGVLGDRFLSARLRTLIFDPETKVGYGWFKLQSKRFDQTVYLMNGRSPGFSSAVAFLSRDHVFTVVLSNLYDSAPSDISLDFAAMLNGRPYQRLTLKTAVDPNTLTGMPASFRFPKEFYQPDALLHLSVASGQVSLDWPSGIRSALIPISKDHFMDRQFWESVEILRDHTGRIEQLKYDQFIGQRVGAK